MSPFANALRASIALVVLSPLVAACSKATIPDPKEALAAYADAAKRGDADAIHGMLTEDAQKAFSKKDIATMVEGERAELTEQAAALEAPGTAMKIRARVRYADGETAELAVEDGELRIQAADALPAGARTPTDALAELRKVLARRSYAGLIRVLTSSTGSAMESDLRALVEGLEEPQAVPVEVKGDTATAVVPGGRRIRLKREAGVWRVEDFD